MQIETDWHRILELIVIVLIAIDIHELAHAVTADALGDPTPRRSGQISLNPFVHMDQIGVVLLVVLAVTGYGFTFGRTFVTPTNLKFGPQRGNAIVAVAGPLSNLVLAALAVVPLSLYANGSITLSPNVDDFLSLAAFVNVLLFVLNLLPLPPLDGFTILGGFLTARQMYSLAPLQQWGPLIILVLFIGDPQLHIIGRIVDPAISQVLQLLCSLGCA